MYARETAAMYARETSAMCVRETGAMYVRETGAMYTRETSVMYAKEIDAVDVDGEEEGEEEGKDAVIHIMDRVEEDKKKVGVAVDQEVALGSARCVNFVPMHIYIAL